MASGQWPVIRKHIPIPNHRIPNPQSLIPRVSALTLALSQRERGPDLSLTLALSQRERGPDRAEFVVPAASAASAASA